MSLTALLGTKTPIVAAPMAGVSSGALAAQVSLAGGFGFISPAPKALAARESFSRDLDTARATLATPAGTPLPIGAGFLGWLLDSDSDTAACLDAALAQRVRAIWLSFGTDLGKWVRHVRARDPAVLVWVLVSSVPEAVRAAREWRADVLVVQGIEAGGHGHSRALPLLTLVPLVQQALPDAPPLVAAGGLTTGAHVAAVLALGAAGAALGTRFVATPEAAASPQTKALLLRARETVRTVAYDEARGTVGWPPGVDGRAVPNKIYEDWQNGLALLERQKLYQDAAAHNDSSRSVVWAGASVALVADLRPAGDVVRTIHDELLTQLRRVAAAFAS